MNTEIQRKRSLLTMTASGLGTHFHVLQQMLLQPTIQQTLIDSDLLDGFIRVSTATPPDNTAVLVTDGRETVSAKYFKKQGWANFYPHKIEVEAWTYYPSAPNLEMVE
jgi:hypothetical protein